MEKAAPFQSGKYRCEVTISEKRHFLRKYAVVTSLPCLFTRGNYQTHFSALHRSQPSLSSYFLVFFNFFSFNFSSLNPFALLNTRVELRENWTPAQNGRLDMFTASIYARRTRKKKWANRARSSRGVGNGVCEQGEQDVRFAVLSSSLAVLSAWSTIEKKYEKIEGWEQSNLTG